MRNLQTLYRFELKKMLSRKIVWITIGVMVILIGLSVCGQLMGGYYVGGEKLDSVYNIFLKGRETEKELTGRVIDQQLLDETWDAYGKIPADRNYYNGTEEFWEYAFPYSAIFGFVRNISNMNIADAMAWDANEVELYSMRQDMLENSWNIFYLTEGEKEYWRRQELFVETPIEYAYKEGWWMLLNYGLYTVGLMAQLTVAVCLSNVFTVEQTRRTDQLILCSRYGKGTLYLAKMFAGISFSAGVSLLYTLAIFTLTMAIYGGDGFSAAIQLIFPDCSAPLSVGGVVLISYGLVFAASILTGVFTMVLSEILRNGIGTLAVIGGITILTMFITIPVQYRVLAQIWSYLPCVLAYTQNILDYRLIPFFGTYLTNIQFVPILYVVTGGILSVTGLKIYQRYQVRAR